MSARHERAIQLGRDGQFDESLEILEQLESSDPSTRKYFYDRLVVMLWASRTEQALDYLSQLNINITPDYVLDAFAKACRETRRYNTAIQFYSELLERDSGNINASLGLALTTAENGNVKSAFEILNYQSFLYPDDRNVLEAIAYVYKLNKDYVNATFIYHKYLELYPNEKRIRRLYILSLRNMGAAELALDQINQFPALLNNEQIIAIQMDQAANHVRWGILPETDYRKRFDNTDVALGKHTEIKLFNFEKTNKLESTNDRRLMFDHIVALIDRYRMVDGIEYYERLLDHNIDIPDYVLIAVGNAYLYQEMPEQAMSISHNILSNDPQHYGAKLLLFYAYIEVDDFPNAYKTIDSLAENQATWKISSDQKIFKSNAKKLEADRVTILARAYGDDLQTAQTALETMLAKSPMNTDVRHDLALVYRWRGWNAKAITQYQRVLRKLPQHISSRVGGTNSNLNRREYRLAEQKLEKIHEQYPENKDVQRLGKEWKSHNKRQLLSDIRLGTSNGTELGSRELSIDTYLYSRPIDYNYRAFLHFNFATADFVEGEGVEQRPGIGLEYRSQKYELTAEINNALKNSEGIGVKTNTNYFVGDHLTLKMDVDLNSLQAPLRGRRAGIDAHRLGFGLNYRWHESQQAGINYSYMDFDDGNSRHSIQAFVERRVINQPRYKLILRLDGYSSKNKTDNVIYYSPKRDVSVGLTADNLWRLYRRYDKVFSHRLRASIGLYEQQGFGTAGTWSLQYEQIWNVNRDMEIIYGISRSRRVFDGEPEFENAIYGKIDWRF